MPSNSTESAPLLNVIGVIIFCSLTANYSDISILGHFFPFSISTILMNKFEHHFWMFAAGFIAIGFVSRGHLWSFGINSKNLKDSMQWLGLLYGFVVLGTVVSLYCKLNLLPESPAELPLSTADTVMSILIYWMSSPVANQILFFGFGQTMLQKSFGYDLRIGQIPVAVILATLMFSFFASDSSFAPSAFSFASTFIIGSFCSVVYWKTDSLITPMLGHGFYFGFPVFVHILSNYV